jgi:hypothetical protein
MMLLLSTNFHGMLSHPSCIARLVVFGRETAMTTIRDNHSVCCLSHALIMGPASSLGRLGIVDGRQCGHTGYCCGQQSVPSSDWRSLARYLLNGSGHSRISAFVVPRRRLQDLLYWSEARVQTKLFSPFGSFLAQFGERTERIRGSPSL